MFGLLDYILEYFPRSEADHILMASLALEVLLVSTGDWCEASLDAVLNLNLALCSTPFVVCCSVCSEINN